jgi:glycosyltransferase involved in cell wall biosynthesis
VQTLCIVVPCYNEERRFDAAAFAAFVRAHPAAALCLVDDGSSDRTAERLEGLRAACGSEAVRIVRLPRNAGKAEAVRQGMLQAAAWKPFEYLAYWDADLAAPLEEVCAMQTLAAAQPACLIVLGSRIRRLGAAITRSAARHYAGRVFATLASLVLRLPVYDTQCGAKLLRAAVVPRMFEAPFVSRWLFDVELLARIRNLAAAEGLTGFAIESPLQSWRERHGSSVTAGAFLQAPLELWTIARRYNR